MAEIVEEIERDGRARHVREKTVPLGPRRVRKARPHRAPEKVAWSPQPYEIALDPRKRKELGQVFAEIVAAYRDAADRLVEGDRLASFPEGTYPPGLPYVPTYADLLKGS